MVGLDSVPGDELSDKGRRGSGKARAVCGVAAPCSEGEPAGDPRVPAPHPLTVRTSRKRAACPADTGPLTVTDDGAGAGIGDASLLMSSGKNGSSEDLLRREDAVGMEMLSLARRGCTISFRPRTTNPNAQPGATFTRSCREFARTAKS